MTACPPARGKGVVEALVLLSFGLVAPFASSWTYADGDPRRDLEAIQQSIADVERNLGGLLGRHDEQVRALRTVEKQIGRIARRLQKLELQRRETETRLRELKRRQQQRRGEIAAQRRLLERQLKAIYVNGKPDYLRMVLSQQDPQRLGRALIYYDYFNRARMGQMRKLEADLRALERLTIEIEAKQASLGVVIARRRAERGALEARRRERAQILASLREAIGAREAKLEQLRRDERRLQALVARLKEEAKASRSAVPYPEGGRFLWPLEGPIRAAFGSRRTRELRWKGVLIEAPAGRPVKAIAGGEVVFADWLRGYGLLLIIDHGGGFLSLYGHNQSLQKEVGSRVVAGEIIATVGDSGGQAHSGLYFEIRRNGEPVDPRRWCVAKK